MSNLLPETTQKELRLEYRIRFVSVVCILIALVMCVALLLLIPSYVASSIQETAMIKKQQAFNERVSLSDSESVFGVVESINGQVKKLSSSTGIVFSDLLERTVLLLRPNGVLVTDILYEQIPKGGLSITVRGVARDRDVLHSFTKVLEDTKEFKTVELPLSNFVKKNDINFVMVLTL